ncbi:Uncharacterized protein HZ326_19843 [Fusarium oxysporum f. sp. albedinis]|nr:Uncharacterized protein HZ326_19843 [Fusarium oxysporum f. sp. albedinis]
MTASMELGGSISFRESSVCASGYLGPMAYGVRHPSGLVGLLGSSNCTSADVRSLGQLQTLLPRPIISN